MDKYTYIQLDQWLTSLSEAVDAKGKLGLAIAHNYRCIRDAIKEYLDTKEEIIIKYGKKLPSGQYQILDEKKLEEANKELSKYVDMKVAVDIMKVEESDFEDCDLTAGQMINLDWMIKHKVVVSSGEDINESTDCRDEPIDPDKFMV